MNAKSLWTAWPAVQRRLAAAPHWLLCFDLDGTLAPLASHPAQVRLPAITRRLLRQLARQPGVWVGVVSGRALREVRRCVGLPGLCYVGNHGLELAGPTLRYVNPVALACRPLIQQLARLLTPALRAVPGAWVENKGLTLSVHYRAVARPALLVLRTRVLALVGPFQEQRRVRVTFGKCVIEVRPAVRWTKGTILQWLWARCQAFGGAEGTLPLYIGDDETDEDAFAAVRERGVTIAVGPSTPLTQAQYAVGSPREVQRLLRQLVALRRARGKRDGTSAGR